MQEYSILLEGFETESKGYFIMFNVLASSIKNAREIVLNFAKENGLNNYNIDDIEILNVMSCEDGNEKILKVSGKSYFST